MNAFDPSLSPVAITLPRIFENEARTLAVLAAETDGIIHIRKPEAPSEALRLLLGELRSSGADMRRFTLHYDEPLAREFGLGGVHLRETEAERIPAGELRRSASCHDWDEALRCAQKFDYVFLSPLFDSVSKQGYRSRIDIGEASARLRGHAGTVVALGGIAPATIARSRQAGFDGAAALGAVWHTDAGRIDTERTLRNYRMLRRKWKAAGGSLQFISDGDMGTAEAFLQGGGRWIQLRMKETPPEEIVRRGREMLALCRKYGAVLIVNDHPALAATTGADGVHLGQSDMPPAEARRIVGEGAIIGSTANTFGQIAERNDLQTDYIGLGPFRYTTTKRNLAPLLGTEGYRDILARMRGADIGLPVVAIGGIETGDVPAILSTGVTGIALSGAVARAGDPRGATERFLAAMDRT